MTRPYGRPDLTEYDILDVLRRHPSGLMTYVIRNYLSSGRPHLKTRQVFYYLCHLEADGKVKRVPSSYKKQVCWAIVR